jgi:hypothetical protein
MQNEHFMLHCLADVVQARFISDDGHRYLFDKAVGEVHGWDTNEYMKAIRKKHLSDNVDLADTREYDIHAFALGGRWS